MGSWKGAYFHRINPAALWSWMSTDQLTWKRTCRVLLLRPHDILILWYLCPVLPTFWIQPELKNHGQARSPIHNCAHEVCIGSLVLCVLQTKLTWQRELFPSWKSQGGTWHRGGLVVTIPNSYSGYFAFDPRHGDRLYGLRIFVVFFIYSRQTLESYLKIGHDSFVFNPLFKIMVSLDVI
jgi:hypothetical protein